MKTREDSTGGGSRGAAENIELPQGIPGVPGAEPVGRFKMCLLRSWPRGLLVQYPSVRLSFFLSA